MSDVWQEPENDPDSEPAMGMLQAMAFSFFSPQAYIDAGKRWTGAGVLYLLLLAALSWIPVTIAAQVRMMGAREEIKTGLVDFPQIDIVDGRLSSPIPQPAIWDLGDEGIIILDTTGTASQEDLDRARLIVTETEIIDVRPFQSRTTDLSDVGELHLDAETMEGWADLFLTWTMPIVYPFAVGSSFVWRLLWGLAYGGVVSAISGLNYVAGLRVAAVAMTPVVWLSTFWMVIGWTPPLWFFFGWMLLMATVVFGAYVNRTDETDADAV